MSDLYLNDFWSSHRLSKRFGINHVTVRKILRANGVQIRGHGERTVNHRKYTLREDAFETPGEQSSYWLGFLLADGCVRMAKNGSCSTTLKLSEVDADHVERFRDFMGSTAPVTRPPAGARVQLISKPLVKSLIALGVKPRKSYAKHLPTPRIPEDMKRHFWRGVVDGDGCIYVAAKRASHSLRLYGHHDTCTDFKKYLESRGVKCGNVRFGKRIWSIDTSGTNAARAIRLLYQDASVALPRKVEKGLRVMGDFP